MSHFLSRFETFKPHSNISQDGITICYRDSSHYFPRNQCQTSGYCLEIFETNDERIIQMPKWVNSELFSMFLDYMTNGAIKFHANISIKNKSQMFQRLLWIGDFMQCEELQDIAINDLILPILSEENCLLFLNEAFKKLKACEESSDIWYILLNSAIAVTAQYLPSFLENKFVDIVKLNGKIFEEVLERSLKEGYQVNSMRAIESLLQTKKSENLFDVYKSRSKIIENKIGNENFSSLFWRVNSWTELVAYDSVPFKLNSHSFQLYTKELNDKVLLVIKLCQDSNDIFSQPLLMGKTEIQFNQSPNKGVVYISESFCLIFTLSINGNEIQSPIIKFMGKDFGSEALIVSMAKTSLLGKADFDLAVSIDYTQSFLLKNISTLPNIISQTDFLKKYEIEGMTSYLTSSKSNSKLAVQLFLSSGNHFIN